MEPSKTWIKPELKRTAVFEEDILLKQASLVYDLAMKAYDKSDMPTYDLLQGVAYMLYMLKAREYEISINTDYDNLKVY